MMAFLELTSTLHEMSLWTAVSCHRRGSVSRYLYLYSWCLDFPVKSWQPSWYTMSPCQAEPRLCIQILSCRPGL